MIAGVRRCDKSCLMLSIADELRESGIPDTNIVFIDLDARGNRKVKDPDALEGRKYRTFEKIRDSYPRYLFTLDPLLQRRDGVRHLNLMEFIASGSELIGTE